MSASCVCRGVAAVRRAGAVSVKTTEKKMAAKKKRGLIDRLLLGSEKSEGYARASLPSNRWELFWDIFKGRFWKLVIINILILIFFIPVALIFFMRSNAISNLGALYPFSQNFGIGYQAPLSMVGYAENIVFTVDSMIYLFMPVALVIAAIGVSGGAYVIRNMVWTEGIFVANDFWRGVKQNIKQIIAVALVYSLVFYLTNLSVAFADQSIAVGIKNSWIFVVSKVLAYMFLVFYSMMTFHMITMSVTYELKFRQLLKNSFLFTIALLPQNILFLFLGLLPFLFLLFGGIFMAIGLILILLMGFSLFFLIWTDFCQWSYDRFINDKIEGAQKNRGIYEKVKESNSLALQKYREQVARTAVSSLSSKPIKPITDDELQLAELPESFNRKDIERLNESKQRLIEDHERYVEEHINDPQFVEARENAEKNKEEREKRIEEAKKELAKRNKN